jgi:acyl dehydratase
MHVPLEKGRPEVMWYEDFEAGSDQKWVSRRRTITEADALLFTAMTGITDPVFTDEIFARENLFGGRVVPGPMVMAYAMGLTDDMCSGSVVAALGINNAKFVSPVRPQDTIWVITTVLSARGSNSRPEHGIVTLAHEVESDRSGQVQAFERTLLVLRAPAAKVDGTGSDEDTR